MKTTDQVLVGVFETTADARRTIEDLRDAHFGPRSIGVLTRNERGEPEVKSFRDLEGDHVGAGAAVGGAAGAGGGALWALGIAAGVLPAIGPVIVGGTLLAVAASAAAGAATGAFVGALVGMGITDEDAAYYQDELIAGRAILVVHPDSRGHLVESIFRANNASQRRRVVQQTLAEQIDLEPQHAT